MNKLATAAITLLIICGAALWFLASGSLNDFVKNQIERVGSQFTEQQVKVAKVDIQLTKGAGSISGLSLSNPSGYQQKQAFTLDDIGLDIDIKSLAKQPIVIESFAIKNPHAFVEFTKGGDANLKQILDSINKQLPKGEQASASSNTQQPKIRVDKLLLSGVTLTLDLRQLGNKEYQETLPDVDLGMVGGQDGLPANELGGEIAKKILDSIWQQAKKSQKKKLVDKAKEKLKDKAEKKLKDLFGKLNG